MTGETVDEGIGRIAVVQPFVPNSAQIGEAKRNFCG